MPSRQSHRGSRGRPRDDYHADPSGITSFRGAIIELDATEADEVKVLANNLPVASGVVLVDRNRIAVEVKQMLPRTPGMR